MSTLTDIRERALSLPLSDRASLALDLITSIDGTDETEIERLWVAEGERPFRARIAVLAPVMKTRKCFSGARRCRALRFPREAGASDRHALRRGRPTTQQRYLRDALPRGARRCRPYCEAFAEGLWFRKSP